MTFKSVSGFFTFFPPTPLWRSSECEMWKKATGEEMETGRNVVVLFVYTDACWCCVSCWVSNLSAMLTEHSFYRRGDDRCTYQHVTVLMQAVNKGPVAYSSDLWMFKPNPGGSQNQFTQSLPWHLMNFQGDDFCGISLDFSLVVTFLCVCMCLKIILLHSYICIPTHITF